MLPLHKLAAQFHENVLILYLSLPSVVSMVSIFVFCCYGITNSYTLRTCEMFFKFQTPLCSWMSVSIMSDQDQVLHVYNYYYEG